MRIWGKILIVVLLLFLFAAPTTADIRYVYIRSDNRPSLLFEKFGFTNSGYVTVEISFVKISYVPVTSNISKPDLSRLGFFLLSGNAQPDFIQERFACNLDSKFIPLLFTFQDLSPPPQSSIKISHNVTFPSEYSLMSANCNPLSYVTMDVRTELYNTHGTTKNYLSVGLTQLPSLHFILTLIYLCFLGYWISLCFKNRPSFQRIHLLMGVFLVTKALYLSCAADNLYHFKATGGPHAWINGLVYVFQFTGDVLWYIVITLIGSGWPFLKPHLQIPEKVVLMIVIPLQVFFNLTYMMMCETLPCANDPQNWTDVLWFVSWAVFLISCIAIICFTGFSSVSLSNACPDDGKAARYLAKLTRLTKFFVMLIEYLLLVRPFLLLVLPTMIEAYNNRWVANAAQEIGSLLFNMVMFYMYRPEKRNAYIVLDDEDEELVVRNEEFALDVEGEEMVVRDEDFEL